MGLPFGRDPDSGSNFQMRLNVIGTKDERTPKKKNRLVGGFFACQHPRVRGLDQGVTGSDIFGSHCLVR
jgi:hypothetical protein